MKKSESVWLYLAITQMRKFLGLILLCLIVSFITACDYGMTQGNQLSEKQEIPPPFHEKKELSMEDVRQIAKKSDKEINITKNYEVDEIPALSPPLVKASMAGSIGFKTTRLFEEKLTNSEDRFDRLEAVVQDMADKFIKLEPSIERLVKIDNDFDMITTQLEVLLDKNNQEAQTQAVSDMVAEKVNKVIPLAGGDQVQAPVRADIQGQSIYAMRLSDHADKARIVIDSSERFELEPELADGHLILRSEVIANSNIQDVSIQNLSAMIDDIMKDSQTGDVLLSVNRPIQSIKVGRIAPSDDNPDYRTYIDVMF